MNNRKDNCKHPKTEGPVAFVSEKLAKTIFSGKMMFENIPVVVDPKMTSNDGIHFPQDDGSCIWYWI